MSEYATCSVCLRELGTYVPKGGDGSLTVMRPHNQRPSVRCAGSKHPPRRQGQGYR